MKLKRTKNLGFHKVYLNKKKFATAAHINIQLYHISKASHTIGDESNHR